MPTIATPELDAPFLEGFAAMHIAMRRDAARLPHAIGRADGAALVRWFERFSTVIEHHHHREDDVMWPALVAVDPSFELHLEQLDADHVALDEAMAALGDALRAGEGRAEAEHFATVLDEHLDREEAAAFPRLARTFTAEMFADVERQLQHGTSLRALSFQLPWAIDGRDPEWVHEQLTTLPLPVRGALRWWWLPAYARIARPLIGADR